MKKSIILLFFVTIFLVIGWHYSQSEIAIHIPPDIPTNGLTIKADSYPKSTIFSFVFYVWQSINDWSEDGETDYSKNIDKYSAYLTPDFKRVLLNDRNERLNNGELQSRIRNMQGLNGELFDPKNVTYLGNGVWLVHLMVRLTERMNDNGKMVKDTGISYTFRVVRSEEDADHNQWGLALDGYAASPDRVKTFV